MHECTVTATSVRKDGTAFQAVLPEYGKVWLNLSDRDNGKIEWKKTYDIAFNVKPGERGNFYNVTRIREPALPQAAFKPQPDGPKAADVGPHIAMWEKLFFEALVSKGAPPGVVTAIEARRLARETLQADLDAKLQPGGYPYNDEEEITF